MALAMAWTAVSGQHRIIYIGPIRGMLSRGGVENGVTGKSLVMNEANRPLDANHGARCVSNDGIHIRSQPPEGVLRRPTADNDQVSTRLCCCVSDHMRNISASYHHLCGR